MARSTKEIDALIRDCQNRLAAAKSGIDALETQLRDLKGQRTLLELDQARIEAELRRYAELLGNQTAERAIGELTTRAHSEGSIALSEKWKAVLMNFAGGNRAPFSIDDVVEFVERNSLDVRRAAIRSQLSVYAAKGIVDRAGSGKYQLTTAGLALLGAFAS